MSQKGKEWGVSCVAKVNDVIFQGKFLKQRDTLLIVDDDYVYDSVNTMSYLW